MSELTTSDVCEDCTTAIPEGEEPALPPGLAENFARALRYREITIIVTLIFYIPIIIFGLFGNSVAFILLLKRSFNSSIYTYLTVLSVTDTIFLLTSVVGWLVFGFTDGAVDLRSIIDCNFIAFFTYVPKQYSSWLLVAVSVERTLVVYFPTKAKDICSVKRARLVAVLLFLVICIINWHCFGGYNSIRVAVREEVDICPGSTPWLHSYKTDIHGWLDSAFYSYIPTVSLIILNGAIMVRFLKAASSSKVGPDGKAAGEMKNRTMAKNSRKMTIMCLTLSAAYLVMTTPHSIHNLVFRTRWHLASTDPAGFFLDFLISQVLSVLYHLNHACNFVLYCLSNPVFRENFINLIRCRVKSAIQGTTKIELSKTKH